MASKRELERKYRRLLAQLDDIEDQLDTWEEPEPIIYEDQDIPRGAGRPKGSSNRGKKKDTMTVGEIALCALAVYFLGYSFFY
jgi:hypothetical protein